MVPIPSLQKRLNAVLGVADFYAGESHAVAGALSLLGWAMQITCILKTLCMPLSFTVWNSLLSLCAAARLVGGVCCFSLPLGSVLVAAARARLRFSRTSLLFQDGEALETTARRALQFSLLPKPRHILKLPLPKTSPAVCKQILSHVGTLPWLQHLLALPVPLSFLPLTLLRCR